MPLPVSRQLALRPLSQRRRAPTLVRSDAFRRPARDISWSSTCRMQVRHRFPAVLAIRAFRPTLTSLTTLYNEELDAGLGSLGAGIVPINAFGLFKEILQDPAAYGFTNVDGTACSGSERLPVCGPSGSGSPATYDPDTNRDYLFADDKHPSGAAHAMLASVVTATLAAPVQVSLAGEAGLAAVASHRGVVLAEQMSELGLERPVGSWRGYTTVHMGQRAVDAPPSLGEARADVRAVTLGASHHATADLWWGAAISLGGTTTVSRTPASAATPSSGRFTGRGVAAVFTSAVL